ncbi:MAG: hypothetical protein PCFJNLEI_02390 [Verrucomicrobiae bacterium]|nr:hypothetical protein [Verrucomicrobiae bacterium]
MNNHQVEKTPRRLESDTYKLRTYFQDVDEQTVKVLTEKYGHLVPPDRLQTMANQPTSFETSPEFAKAFKAEAGVPPEAGVVGYTERGRPAHVSTEDMASVPETTVHERLHQLSDARAPEIFGPKLYEGVTEDLAIETVGREPSPGDPVAYPEERASAHLLREKVGNDAVEEAYFRGDSAKLTERLNDSIEETKPEDQ